MRHERGGGCTQFFIDFLFYLREVKMNEIETEKLLIFQGFLGCKFVSFFSEILLWREKDRLF